MFEAEGPSCRYPDYIMAASPPEKTEVEQTQSGEDDGDMKMQEEGQQGQGLGDFEVKEQDRWLPIANGWSSLILYTHPWSTVTLSQGFVCHPPITPRFDLPMPCVERCVGNAVAQFSVPQRLVPLPSCEKPTKQSCPTIPATSVGRRGPIRRA